MICCDPLDGDRRRTKGGERSRNGFKLGLLHKDLLIVRQLAEAAGVDRTVIEASIADYAELMSRGLADEDTSALIRLKRPAR